MIDNSCPPLIISQRHPIASSGLLCSTQQHRPHLQTDLAASQGQVLHCHLHMRCQPNDERCSQHGPRDHGDPEVAVLSHHPLLLICRVVISFGHFISCPISNGLSPFKPCGFQTSVNIMSPDASSSRTKLVKRATLFIRSSSPPPSCLSSHPLHHRDRLGSDWPR